MKELKEVLINLLNFFGLAWWIELATDKPRCTYYFGPFMNKTEAEVAKTGYIEDLEQEGAQGIRFVVKRCKPGNLTVYEDLGEISARRSSPVFSGQM